MLSGATTALTRTPPLYPVLFRKQLKTVILSGLYDENLAGGGAVEDPVKEAIAVCGGVSPFEDGPFRNGDLEELGGGDRAGGFDADHFQR